MVRFRKRLKTEDHRIYKLDWSIVQILTSWSQRLIIKYQEQNMIRFSSQEMVRHTWLNISKLMAHPKYLETFCRNFLIIYLPGQDSANNVNKKCLSWQLIFVFQWLEARQLKPAPLTAFHQYDQGTIKQKRHTNPPPLTSRKSISLCSLTNFLVYLSLIYQQQFWVWSK